MTSECNLSALWDVLYVVHCFHRTGSLSVFCCIADPRLSLTNAEVLKFNCLHRSCLSGKIDKADALVSQLSSMHTNAPLQFKQYLSVFAKLDGKI